MNEIEKMKEAYRMAGEAFDEVYIEKYGGRLDQMQWPETKLRAIGPMAAEIYRQMNRTAVMTAPEGATRESVNRMAQNLATTIHAKVIICQAGHEVVISDDESINIDAEPEGADNELCGQMPRPE